MNTFSRFALAAALALVFAAPLSAADKAARAQAKGKKAASPQVITQVQKQLEAAGLSEEQTKKIKAINEEFTPKLQGAQKKLAELLTDEQKKARKEAADKAKADGAKRKDAAAALKAALKLTAEQQAKFDAADKEAKDAAEAYRTAVLGVLTEEQKAKVNLGGRKKAK